MAFQAGAVNAGGFIAAGRFVTHTTGFATHFGYELANHHEGAAIGMLSVPVFFLLGAMITSYFVDLRLTHGRPANYEVPSFLIFLCLTAAMLLGSMGLFGLFGEKLVINQDYFFLVLLCLASGLQNAMITNSSGVVVRTTHLTGVTTDLAVGLVRTFFGERRKDAERLTRDRLATMARAGIIGSFVLGSTTSAYLYLKAHYVGFLVPVITSLILLRYFILRTKHKAKLNGVPMRSFIAVLFLFALAPSAFASPERQPPDAGRYSFQNSFSVAMKLHYEVVYALNDAGRAHLETLQKQGYECWNKGADAYLCKTFQSTEGASDVVRSRVEQELGGHELLLGKLRGEPSLISEGTDVAEYQVVQPAKYAGKSFSFYRLVMTQGNWSIRLGDFSTGTGVQFNLSQGGELTMPGEFFVTESKTAYSVYLVMADFRRM